MAFLNKVKENVNLKEGVSRITAKVSDIAQSGKEKGQELLHRNKSGKSPFPERDHRLRKTGTDRNRKGQTDSQHGSCRWRFFTR